MFTRLNIDQTQNTNGRFIKFIPKLLYEHLWRESQWLSITKPFQNLCPLSPREQLLYHHDIFGTSTVIFVLTNCSFHSSLESSMDKPTQKWSYTLYYCCDQQARVTANIQPQRFLSRNSLHILWLLCSACGGWDKCVSMGRLGFFFFALFFINVTHENM